MKKFVYLFTLLIWTISSASSDNHASQLSALEAAIQSYWAARNTRDHAAVAGLESRTGVLATNSDGSFHKPLTRSTAEQWKTNMAGTEGSVQIFALELTELSPSIVYARYYLEGMTGAAGAPKPYRTRVTSVWVQEDGQWKQKTGHFSGANFGGTYATTLQDYED